MTNCCADTRQKRTWWTLWFYFIYRIARAAPAGKKARVLLWRKRPKVMHTIFGPFLVFAQATCALFCWREICLILWPIINSRLWNVRYFLSGASKASFSLSSTAFFCTMVWQFVILRPDMLGKFIATLKPEEKERVREREEIAVSSLSPAIFSAFHYHKWYALRKLMQRCKLQSELISLFQKAF